MKNLITQQLSVNQKNEVFNIIENWSLGDKLISPRSQNKKVPASVIKPIIEVYMAADQKAGSSAEKLEIAREWLKLLPGSSVVPLNENAKKDLEEIVERIQQDEEVERLTYEQTIFFFQWIRRLLPDKDKA